MKKIKMIYKVALLAIVAGLVLMGAGYALGAGDIAYINIGEGGIRVVKPSEQAGKIVAAEGGFTTIDIEAGQGRIVFEPRSMGFGVEVSNYIIEPTVSIQNGRLTVSMDTRGFMFTAFGFTGIEPEIKVYFPHGAEFDTVNVRSASGEKILNGFLAEAVDVRSTSGRVRIQNVTADTLNVQSTSGQVLLDGVTAGHLRSQITSGSFVGTRLDTQGLFARSTSGRVELSGALRGTNEIHITSGSVSVASALEQSAYSSDITVVSGSIRYGGQRIQGWSYRSGPEADNHFIIRSTSGSVTVEFNE